MNEAVNTMDSFKVDHVMDVADEQDHPLGIGKWLSNPHRVK